MIFLSSGHLVDLVATLAVIVAITVHSTRGVKSAAG